jgi:GT2 family glycosyltransferase
LVISNLNGKEMLEGCLNSLESLDYPNYEIIVVDAGSSDGAPELVAKEFPRVRLIREKRIGIGEAINKGLLIARGDIIAFDLNNDEVFSKHWLTALVEEILSSKEKKVVGGIRLLAGSDELIDAAGKMMLYDGRVISRTFQNIKQLPKSSFEVDYVEAPAFRRELLNIIGSCDEKYYIWYEDSDFCIKAARAGYQTYVVPTAISHHRRSATMKTHGVNSYYYFNRDTPRFIIKHYTLIRMEVALATWCAYRARDIIYDLRWSVHTDSREPLEYLLAVLRSFAWNLSNLKDHFRARAEVQSLKAT